MKFSFESKVVMTLEHNPGESKSKLVKTDLNLYVSKNVDAKIYLEDGLPTKEGSRILSMVLIQGIVGNIHASHQKGFRDSAEHLKWLIEEVERGLAASPEVYESEFE